jgi:hypothetical protein
MFDPYVQHRIASYLKWRIAVRGSIRNHCPPFN